jgi:hypothetical protein
MEAIPGNAGHLFPSCHCRGGSYDQNNCVRAIVFGKDKYPQPVAVILTVVFVVRRFKFPTFNRLPNFAYQKNTGLSGYYLPKNTLAGVL